MNIGAFEVLKTLGSGAGSTIFKVRRHEDQQVYALKIIKVACKDDHKYVWQIENEFAIGSALDHKNLVKVFALEKQYRLMLWLNGGKLLLEYVDGQPLSDLRDVPLPRLVKIFVQAADGLSCMHQSGFFHADIKPENLMVTPDNRVKVIDFGLAWRRKENRQRVQGTLEYLAPEQARDRVVNAKTDIFNFGATMYRMITGKAVPALWREGVKQETVPPLSDQNENVPRELDDLVRACVAFDPNHRPRVMREVRERLREIRERLKGKDVDVPSTDDTPVI